MSNQLNQNNQNDYYSQFCYMQITTTVQACMQMGLVILGIPLLIISLQQFQKRLKHNKITDIIKLTYVCLITSLICTYFYLQFIIVYFIKVIFQQIVFWYQYHNQPKKQLYDQYFIANKYMLVIDSFLNFIIRSAVLLVPANCLQGVTYIFTQCSKRRHLTPQQKQQYLTSIKFQLSCKSFLNYYFVIRFIVFTTIISACFIIQDNHIVNVFYVILIVYFQLQSVLVLVFLILSAISIKKNVILQRLLLQEYKTMLINYVKLIVVIVLRLASDIFFVAYHFNGFFNSVLCYAAQASSSQLSYDIAVLLDDIFITYYFPISIILWIYWIRNDGEEVQVDLLTDQNTQNKSNINNQMSIINDENNL